MSVTRDMAREYEPESSRSEREQRERDRASATAEATARADKILACPEAVGFLADLCLSVGIIGGYPGRKDDFRQGRLSIATSILYGLGDRRPDFIRICAERCAYRIAGRDDNNG